MRMINAQLQEMKKKSGMSNKDIAEKFGISLSTVNRIMSGQTDIPNYQTICDLVIAMGSRRVAKRRLPRGIFGDHQGQGSNHCGEECVAKAAVYRFLCPYGGNHRDIDL